MLTERGLLLRNEEAKPTPIYFQRTLCNTFLVLNALSILTDTGHLKCQHRRFASWLVKYNHCRNCRFKWFRTPWLFRSPTKIYRAKMKLRLTFYSPARIWKQPRHISSAVSAEFVCWLPAKTHLGFLQARGRRWLRTEQYLVFIFYTISTSERIDSTNIPPTLTL